MGSNLLGGLRTDGRGSVEAKELATLVTGLDYAIGDEGQLRSFP